jgi:hypothetical protein
MIEAARSPGLLRWAILGASDPSDAARANSDCGVANRAEAVAEVLAHSGGVAIEE